MKWNICHKCESIAYWTILTVKNSITLKKITVNRYWNIIMNLLLQL